jgi:predicted PurR-regulated permease PerM
MFTSQPWRLSLQAWISLLTLGLTLWLTITHAGLVLEVLSVIFAALLLSLVICPLADKLSRWRIPRGITVIGLYIGLGGILALLGSLLVPVFKAEFAALQSNAPVLLQSALSQLTAIPLLKQWVPSTSILAQNLAQRLDILFNTLVSTATGIGGLAVDLGLVLVLTYFFTKSTGWDEHLLNDWVPPRHRPRVRVVVVGLRQRLSRWVWAQAVIAVYFALIFSAGLALLGVPFAFTIGLVGGVLEIVPYLGGITATLLAVISALTVNPWLALWVILLYVVVMEIEAHIVAPALYGRVIGLHPALILVALLIGAKTKGILGIFFAVPILVVLAALLEEVRITLVSAESEPIVQKSTEEG